MEPKRVTLLIETSSSWGSQIIAGISDYVRRHERWVLQLDHRGTYEKQSIPSGWKCDGVIARVTSVDLAAEVARKGVPTVNVSLVSVPDTRFSK